MFDLLDNAFSTFTDSTKGCVIGELNTQIPFAPSVRVSAITLRAESVRQMLVSLPTNFPHALQSKSSSEKGFAGGFYAFSSYDAALDTFVNKPYTIRSFTTKDDQVKLPEANGNDVFFDLSGDFIDLGRVLEGHPEHFGSMTMGNPRGLFATVVINIGATSELEADCINARAQRVIRLVDWLESQRIRTSILALLANQCIYTEILVKQLHDPLDLDALAVVTHSDFRRRCLFRVAEYSKTWEYGYGTSAFVRRGSLCLPEVDQGGFLIFSENQDYAEIVHKNFDRAEQGIANAIMSGDKYFSLVI